MHRLRFGVALSNVSGEGKSPLDEKELEEAMEKSAQLTNVRICGLMGMASFTEDMNKVRAEFHIIKTIFDKHAKPQTSNFKPQTSNFKPQTLSTGMSNDYKIAIEEGSTMVRIGSLLFGERN
jgi:hypothetical protein